MENRFQSAHLVGIGIIACAILAGPVIGPPEFDWLRHSTSEQAGQGVPGAWLMRLGFVAYGSGVIVSAWTGLTKRLGVRLALIAFGAGLLATAVWSNASILPDYPSDMGEDTLHSWASGLVGLSFAVAAAARLFVYDGWRRDVIGWVGLAASVAIPFMMFNVFPDARGLLQRVMFAISMVLVVDEFRRP